MKHCSFDILEPPAPLWSCDHLSPLQSPQLRWDMKSSEKSWELSLLGLITSLLGILDSTAHWARSTQPHTASHSYTHFTVPTVHITLSSKHTAPHSLTQLHTLHSSTCAHNTELEAHSPTQPHPASHSYTHSSKQCSSTLLCSNTPCLTLEVSLLHHIYWRPLSENHICTVLSVLLYSSHTEQLINNNS